MKKLQLTAPVASFEYKSEYLPLKNKKITLRQCVNRETYQLLNAQTDLPKNPTDADIKAAKDSREFAVKQLVQNCILNDDIDVGNLPLFLVEDILLKIISASNNNLRELTGNCKNCDEQINFTINLDDVIITTGDSKPIDKIYKLDDSVCLSLKVPTINDGMPDANWTATDFLKTCIESVCNGDDVYYSSEYDLTDFIDSMGLSDITAIMQNWYSKQPHTYLKHKAVCKKCNSENVYEFRGLDDFF